MRESITPQIVGVIFSRADFRRARRMRNPPDFFELRLDALAGCLATIREGIDQLPASFIVTARHPREGGANEFSLRERRDLLLAFLPGAAWLDVELRSVRTLAKVLQEAKANRIRTIISFHDFRGTPSASQLDEISRAAKSLGPDIVKIATRTDTPSQLQRLLEFFDRQLGTPKVVAMGIGKLGRESRLEVARRRCPFNYAHLGTARVPGQLSLRELRRALQ